MTHLPHQAAISLTTPLVQGYQISQTPAVGKRCPSSLCPCHLEHFPDVTLESVFYLDLEHYQTLILETVHVRSDKHHTFKKIFSQSDSTAGDLNPLACKSISQQMVRRSPTHRQWKFYQEKRNHNSKGREKACVWVGEGEI